MYQMSVYVQIYKIKLNNRKQSSVEAERLIKENGFDIKTNAFELQKIYELGGR